MLTEMLYAGVFTDLTSAQIAALLSCFVFQVTFFFLTLHLNLWLSLLKNTCSNVISTGLAALSARLSTWQLFYQWGLPVEVHGGTRVNDEPFNDSELNQRTHSLMPVSEHGLL